MAKKLGITELRRQLKFYMEEVQRTSRIYRTGPDDSVYLLSGETLARLQRRYYMNRWAQGHYSALRLDQYKTLMDGKKTKDLPLNMILALSSAFQLVGELVNVLARPGAKENACQWEVSEYVQKAVEKRPQDHYGKFSPVYGIIRKLFHSSSFRNMEEKTLYGFFAHVQALYGKDRENGDMDGMNLKAEGLTEEQFWMVWEIIRMLFCWASALMEHQYLEAWSKEQQESVFLLFAPVTEWYEENVGALPEGMSPGVEAEYL